MGYPAKLLGEGERIELDLHPHWKALVVPVLVLIVITGATGALVWLIPDSFGAQTWLRLAVVLLALAAAVPWVLVPWLRWFTTTYTFTDRRLIIRSGIVQRTGRDMPLARVDHAAFSHESLLDRMLGCGTLVVESAGENGQIRLEDLPDVEEVHRELYRLVEEDDARRRREVVEDDYAVGGA